MPKEKGPEWDCVVVVSRSSGNRLDKLKCIYCQVEFCGGSTRIRNHIISAKGAGVGGCKGSPPVALIEKFKSLDQEKRELSRNNELKRKLEASLRSTAAAKSGTQSDIRGFKAEKDDADAAVARFFYAEGIPFVKSESKYFREMLQAVCRQKCSTYQPPGRAKLSEALLEKEYQSVKRIVDEQQPKTIPSTLTTDGWKATNNEPLVNFMICSGRDR